MGLVENEVEVLPAPFVNIDHIDNFVWVQRINH
jgi:hypothetical protein